MNTFKKTIALLMCFVLAFSFVGCGKNDKDDDAYHTDRHIPTEDDVIASIPEDGKEHETKLEDWKGPKDYVIVVPKGDVSAKESAGILQDWFKEKAKVELKIVTDDVGATDKEILIGNTNRLSFEAKEGEYFAKLDDGKLVFGGGHDVTVKKAVQIYTRLDYQEGKAYTFNGSSDFVGEKLGYTYVWGDEFETKTLNSKLWNRATKMAATAEMDLDNTELTTKTENGYLKMFALRHWAPKKAGVEFAAPWSVTTMETMSYKYGYVEIRAKVPFGRGTWPSFWASSSGALGPKRTFDYSIEVDIFEVFASRDTLAPNIHKWYDDGDHTMWADEWDTSREGYKFDSLNIKNEYHTYGFEWTPTKMIMYVDDKPYYEYDLTRNFDNGESGMGGFDTPIYLIFNNHLFTQSSTYKPYEGSEIKVGELPAEYVIDWVRLYQKDDGKSKLYLAE